MTLTYDLERGGVKLKQHTKYLTRKSFSSKVIARTHRHTHRTDCSTWTTKVVGDKQSPWLWLGTTNSQTFTRIYCKRPRSPLNNSVRNEPILANVNSRSCSLYAVARPSVVCLSVVCNARAPCSGSWNFRQYFYDIWYFGHPFTSIHNIFAEIVPGERLRSGS